MSSLRPLAFAAVGGLVVAAAFLALGVTGRRTTQTVVREAPMAAQPVSSSSRRLTPNALYERDAPGVVYVTADARKPVRDPFAVRAAHSKGPSTGSGFLVGRSGKILTTYDVVDGADRDDGVSVRFGDGASVPAAVVASDPGADVALLSVRASDLPHVPPLPLGDSTTVRVGDPALAIANPFGADRTLASGIVSALQRELPGPGGATISNVIETQMPVYAGSSGGPLLDAGGRVIGINSQVQSAPGRGVAAIAFAIPIDTAKALLEHAGAAR